MYGVVTLLFKVITNQSPSCPIYIHIVFVTIESCPYGRAIRLPWYKALSMALLSNCRNNELYVCLISVVSFNISLLNNPFILYYRLDPYIFSKLPTLGVKSIFFLKPICVPYLYTTTMDYCTCMSYIVKHSGTNNDNKA